MPEESKPFMVHSNLKGTDSDTKSGKQRQNQWKQGSKKTDNPLQKDDLIFSEDEFDPELMEKISGELDALNGKV